MIRTLVGLQWLVIDCTDNADALYLDKVALMDYVAHSCHILLIFSTGLKNQPSYAFKMINMISSGSASLGSIKVTFLLSRNKVLKRSSPLTL